MQINDPLGLPLGKVGQRGIVAQQKAQALIIVLDIQGWAHIGRHLVYKTEQAVVGALVHLIHQIGLKIQAQILPLRLSDGNRAHMVIPAQPQHRFGIIAVKPVVQHVHDLVAVDLQQLLPHGDPGLFRRGMRVYGCDDGTHGESSPIKWRMAA